MFVIIIGLIVGLLVLAAEQMLNGGPRIGDEEGWFTLSEVDASGWMKAISTAILCAVVWAVIPSGYSDSWIIVATAVVMIVLLLSLCREWHRNVEPDIAELVIFLILAVVFGGMLIRVSFHNGLGDGMIQEMAKWFAIGWSAVTICYILVRYLILRCELGDWAMITFVVVALIGLGITGTVTATHVTATHAAAMMKAAEDAEQQAIDESAEYEEEVEVEVDDLRFVQEWTSNENNRLDNEFSAKLAKKAKNEDGEITPDIVEETVLENCGHDARLLAIWANAFGLWDNPNSYEALLTEDETYLSDGGIRLYNKLEGYLAAVEVVREDAPEDGTNTGYSEAGYVASSEAGISGDRTGTKFTSPDEKVEQFWLMDRCSNLVYKNPPKVPKGPTDNPDDDDNPPKKKHKKDPNKAPKKNTEPNDDKGPGEDTNNKKDPQHSTKDTKDSTSNSGKTYEEVKKDQDEKKEINQKQKTGSDNNNPSTPAPSKDTKVDNNGDKGTGNGGINTPTPVKEKAKEADTGKTINEKPGEEWGGPSD